jgi:hypothetical protein
MPEVHFHDFFDSSVGQFKSSWATEGFGLEVKANRVRNNLGTYPSRQAAHQAIGEQKTQFLPWDELPPAQAHEEAYDIARWRRVPFEFLGSSSEQSPVTPPGINPTLPPTSPPHRQPQ